MPSKPYDKDLIELIAWLRKKKIIVRILKDKPPEFYLHPTYWKRFNENKSE